MNAISHSNLRKKVRDFLCESKLLVFLSANGNKQLRLQQLIDNTVLSHVTKIVIKPELNAERIGRTNRAFDAFTDCIAMVDKDDHYETCVCR